MIGHLAMVAALTFVPFFELRASIPYGIITLGQENWLIVFLIAVACNIILGTILYSFFSIVLRLVARIPSLDRLYKKHLVRAQRKIHKGVVKYGVLSLGLFIGIPLPGTGSYSGALVANLLGMRKREFFLANIIGVLLAGIVVTAVMVSGSTALSFLLKR